MLVSAADGRQLDFFAAEVVSADNSRYYMGVKIEEVPSITPAEAIRRIREQERSKKLSVAAAAELDQL